MSTVAHHFHDAEQQQHAATLGMWLFLASEVLFFGGAFLGYSVYRGMYPHAFAVGSEQLDVWFGTINTGVLLLSSLTMALAVHAVQTNRVFACVRFLLATIALAIVFLAVKSVEYSHKFEEGLVPGPSFTASHVAHDSVNFGNLELFFSFYFVMTGIHALHIAIGIGVLSVFAWQAFRRKFSADYPTPIEMVGLYWHFVDIIWVYLFPLLYFVGSSD